MIRLIFLIIFISCNNKYDFIFNKFDNYLNNINHSYFKEGDYIPNFSPLDKHYKLYIYLNDVLLKNNFIHKLNTYGNKKLKILLSYKNKVIASKYCDVIILPNYKVRNLKYRITNIYPHNKDFFTQGLYYNESNKLIYESTGLIGKSRVVYYNLNNKICKVYTIKDKIFGEGLTILKDNVYQLTWKDKVVYIYDLNLKLISKKKLPYIVKEGWGLTNIGDTLVVSNGSSYIYFLDKNLNYLNRVQVVDNMQICSYLNELEYKNGFIYANIYHKNGLLDNDYIISINPKNGVVYSKLYLNGINSFKKEYFKELNGITFKKNNMLITGKLWDKIFELQLF